jgi:hypothetical protein
MANKTIRDLTDEEFDALANYAAKHGRTWKMKLREAWMNASEPGTLQYLRNTWGPAGLAAFKVDAFSMPLPRPKKTKIEPLDRFAAHLKALTEMIEASSDPSLLDVVAGDLRALVDKANRKMEKLENAL